MFFSFWLLHLVHHHTCCVSCSMHFHSCHMLVFLCSSWTEKHTENFGLIFIISISLHIYIAKRSERNQDNGHYHGIGGDGFLCLTLPTACQLQVKNNKFSKRKSILFCRCFGYIGIFLLIVL